MIKKITSAVFVFAMFFCFNLGVSAAEFKSEDNPIVSEPTSNLHLAGNNVSVKSDIKKDLVVIGGEISVTGKIERNISAAAVTLNINSPEVGGTVRVAGGQVFLSGNFKEDVIVVGERVNIDKANIEGDLVVATNSFTINNSQVKGNIKGSYTTLDGDLKSQVVGKIEVVEMAQKQDYGSHVMASINWIGEFSIFVFLLALAYLLYKNQKLVTNVKFEKTFGTDLLLGLGIIILPIVLLFISIFLFVFPIVTVIVAIVYLLCFLSSIYLPVYLANWLRNTFELSLDIRYLTAASYLTLLVLNVFSLAVPAVSVIIFVYAMANIGYLSRVQVDIYKKALASRTEVKDLNK